MGLPSMAEQVTQMSKGTAYRWLAQFLLCPPTRETLEAYRADDGQRILDQLEALPALAPVAAWLRDQVAEGQDLADLQKRMTRAFSLAFEMGGPRAVPPYASVYLSDSGRLFQKPTRDMVALLNELDMGLPADVNEPADHLAIQLHISAELLERAEDGQELPLTPSDFLDSHVLTWLPDFAERCENLTEPTPIADFVKAALGLCRAEIAAADT